MSKTTAIISASSIERVILVIRNQKVLVDADLARLYGVSVKQLNQAVKRNRKRFPDDFMFQLTWAEVRTLSLGHQPSKKGIPRSQIVTLESGRNLKYRPFVFTEQGVAMLSSVLRSPRAVHVNIEIMRAFVRLRQLIAGHKELAARIDELETKFDGQFSLVFEALRDLLDERDQIDGKKPVGFKTELEGRSPK